MSELSSQELGTLLARLLAATRSFVYFAERNPQTGALTRFEIAQPERAQALLPLLGRTSYSEDFLASILPEDARSREANYHQGATQLQNRFRCRDQWGVIHTIHEEASIEGNRQVGVLSLLPSTEPAPLPIISPPETSHNPRLLRRRTATITAAEIETALTQSQFSLAYQFQLSPRQHCLVSAEVFLRWRHPQQGLLFPTRFLPVAEEAGLMGAIGHWIASAACAQQAHWQAAGYYLPLALNLSTRQLLAPDFAQSLPDAPLLLEFSESALHHGSALGPGIRPLAQRGFQIGIDNAGLEPLDPNLLATLPLSYLKLSRALVQDLQDPISAQKARHLRELGRACNLTLIADGVETPEQAQWLQAEGYEQLQGYLYSRPIAAEALEEILRSGSHQLPEPPYQRAA